MREVTNTVAVHVPAEMLWDYLADYEKVIRLAGSTTQARLKSGAVRTVGATYEGSLAWEGIQSTWVVHLREATPPESLTWETCSHGGECRMRFDLKPVDTANTSVKVALSWGASKPNAPLEPFAWGLLTPLLKRAIRRLGQLTPEDVSC